MRILFIAPQPFFINRGTPIAVRTMTEALGALGHKVDLLTYHIGETMVMNNVRICRTPGLPIHEMPTGFSFAKLILDVPLFFKMLGMLYNRKYDVIHCVEESIFLALISKIFHRTPCVFDMDSSMPEQLVQKGRLWKNFSKIFFAFEKWAIKRCLCCFTICKTLTDTVLSVSPDKKVFQLEDVPLMVPDVLTPEEKEELKQSLGIGSGKLCVYVGNFSRYQGIDLMFQAFIIVAERKKDSCLLIVGGDLEEIEKLRKEAERLGIDRNISFAGRREPDESARLMKVADILISPRTHGTNTPMKIYTYMASGMPIVATNLLTHTQVLNNSSAVLVKPSPQAMAEGIISLMDRPQEGRRLAEKAKIVVESKYSREMYLKKLTDAYDWIEKVIT